MENKNITLKDLKGEFRLLDCDDNTFGFAVDTFYECCGQLLQRNKQLPKKWRYEADSTPIELDNPLFELLNKVDTETLVEFANLMFRYCQFLEFVGCE